MHPLEKETRNIIIANSLLDSGETVVVGVSGGPDSMALLHLLSRLAEELGIQVVAANLNHGLRPSESAAEADLVRQQADALGVASVYGAFDVGVEAKSKGLSIEDVARRVRYNFLGQVADQHEGAKIAVAHTADDQAEEVVLRLIRGTGRKGLSGMDMSGQGRVIRPFLNFPKKRLLLYLKDRGIPFLEDSSNQDRSFLRNRVRLDLIPYLEEHFNPSIRANLRQTATVLKAEDEILASISNMAFLSVVEILDQSGAVLNCHELNKHDQAIRRRLLEKVLWQVGARPSFRKIEQLVQLVEPDMDGRQVHLQGGLRVRRELAEMIFAYPAGRGAGRGNLIDDSEMCYSVEIPGPGSYDLPEIGLRVEVVWAGGKGVTRKRKDGRVYLDGDKVEFPLLVRNRRPGDRFHPMGSPGRKKVKDFLIDQKIPASKRHRHGVVLQGEEIIALLDLRVAEPFKVGEQCSKAVLIRTKTLYE